MKENHDKHQVIMSVENYEALLRAADKSTPMLPRELRKITRHVRKFNSPQRAKRAIELKEEEAAKWLLRTRTKKLVKDFEGKTVIAMYHYPDRPSIGLPGTLKGFSNQGVGMVAVELHERYYGKCVHLLEELVMSPEEYDLICAAEIRKRREEAFKEIDPEDPKTLQFRSKFLP